MSASDEHRHHISYLPPAQLVELYCDDCDLRCYPLAMGYQGTAAFLARHSITSVTPAQMLDACDDLMPADIIRKAGES